MGNGILIIGPCSSRRGIPYPQADTLINLESATFFYACSFCFVQFLKSTSKKKEKKKKEKKKKKRKFGPEPWKKGASLSLHDRLSLGLSQYYEAAKFPSGQSALVNVWFLVSKQRFLGRNTNHKLVNSFLHKTWSSLYHDGVVKCNFKSLKMTSSGKKGKAAVLEFDTQTKGTLLDRSCDKRHCHRRWI